MTRIVVSQRLVHLMDRGETRDCLDQALVRWIETAGYLPFPIPNCLTNDNLFEWLEVISPVGVVLSGGDDVGTDLGRDMTERSVLEYSEKRGLAVLGICRGMQHMGVLAGAGLTKVAGHSGTRHGVLGNAPPRMVNSYHNLVLDACPREYLPLAWASDGSLEAMKHRTQPWLAWMWHPEREETFDQADLLALQSLVRGSARWQA